LSKRDALFEFAALIRAAEQTRPSIICGKTAEPGWPGKAPSRRSTPSRLERFSTRKKFSNNFLADVEMLEFRSSWLCRTRLNPKGELP
jgi:hypothetical protein